MTSKKRVADHQINKDEYENRQARTLSDADEDEARQRPDVFVRADAATIQSRRRLKVSRNADGSVVTLPVQKNPFANVTLGSAASGDTAPDAKPQPTNVVATTTTTTTTATTTAAPVFGASTAFRGFGTVVPATTATNGFPTTLPNTNLSNSEGGVGTATTDNNQSSTVDAISTNSGSGGSVFGSFAGFGNAVNHSNSNGSSNAFSFAHTVATAADNKAEHHDDKNTAGATSPPTNINKPQAESKSTSPDKAAIKATTAPSALWPSSYQVTSGEEDELVIWEQRCRTHRWGTSTSAAPSQFPGASATVAPPSVPPSHNALVPPVADSTTTTSSPDSDSHVNHAHPDGTTAAATTTVSSSWQEVGVGPLRVLQNPVTQHVRLVQRRQVDPSGPVTILLWNVPVWRESVVARPSDKHVQITTLDPATKATRVLLVKVGLATEAAKLAVTLENYMASAHAKSFVSSASTSLSDGSDATKPAEKKDGQVAVSDNERAPIEKGSLADTIPDEKEKATLG